MERRIPIKGMMLHNGRTAPNSWGASEARRGLGRAINRVVAIKNNKTGEAEGFVFSICSAPWLYFLGRRRYISVKIHCQG